MWSQKESMRGKIREKKKWENKNRRIANSNVNSIIIPVRS